ncbi:hypothetical protein [Enterococcus malodoratus]|uniref:hypothetical protein n=1 Tax=Enterococcus malodoratus TaxID=71451 RepID=UPI0022E3AA0F|nr:hypothetical protein [Enterococcus malodoratus]
MKKIYWLRRLFALTVMFIIGAASTGTIPTWIRILLVVSVVGYILLSEEFEFDAKKIETR